MQLPDKYDTKNVEQKWQQWWEAQQIYRWDPSEPRHKNFSIDTPPPTVSGMLHMGHVFSYTQADFIARFKRMRGYNVYYPMGFDDNGLPTERLVEKIKEVKAGQMPRHEFIALCKEVVDSAEEEFRDLFGSIALSVDWSQEYQTISAQSRKLSQMSFLDLYHKRLVKRQHAPTFWDHVDRTAIAQAEIDDKEKQGVMHEIAFQTEQGERIVIATTRPEMLPACVAIFYHPEDARYQRLAHQHAITPIFNARVPIIADHDVAIDKGTGLVMCCTFGDVQDIEWWRRHGLPLKECLSLEGLMQNAESYTGLKIKEARQKIVEDLEAQGLVLSKENITQVVKCAERSGAPLELIATSQWFIAVMDYKEQLLAKASECRWHPDYMQVRLENWIKGLKQDWCISRQRYFGVPFPVWYSKRTGEEGKILLPTLEQLPVDPLVDLPSGYTREEVQADIDVMDTWATSAITPQLNSRALNNEYALDIDRHHKLYPFDMRPQAHEIIRTWAFATIVKSLHHGNSIPWQHLAISGWCLAADKTKMSKSKGNVVTPTDLIVEKGSDVVRYWAAHSKLGVDIVYSEELFKIGHKLVTKLWNVAKFLSLHLGKLQHRHASAAKAIESGDIYETLDLWIISRLGQVIIAATAAFERFDYAEARMITEDFFWNDWCDNYLELIKVRVYDQANNNPRGQQSTIQTLRHVMDGILLLFAPVLPHITEELAQLLELQNTEQSLSIHRRGSWPDATAYPTNVSALQHGETATQLLGLVRKVKSQHNVSLRTPLATVAYESPTPLDASALSDANAASVATASSHTTFTAEQLASENILCSEDNKYKVWATLKSEE